MRHFTTLLAANLIAACLLVSPTTANEIVEPVMAESVPIEPAPFTPAQDDRWVKVAAYDHQAPAKATDVQPAAAQTPANNPAPNEAAPTTAATPSFAKRIAMLEVALSRRVAEQPSLWRFDDIEGDAAKLLSEAKDDAERQAVRSFATRVDRFSVLADRYRSVRSTVTQLETTLPPTAPIAQAPAALTPIAQAPVAQNAIAQAQVVGVATAQPSTPANYDAVGELRPVVSKRAGAPEFALVGDDGKIVTFVTPAGGLDLKPLLGKRVGARGGRGFMPEYRHRHLTAQKVTPLETLRR